MVMKNCLILSIFSLSLLHGQLRPQSFPAEDQEVTQEQARDIFRALRAVNFEAKEVVFPIFSGRSRLAYGVSLGEGRLLTKASEVISRGGLFTMTAEQDILEVRVVGLYPEEDLAVLSVPELDAAPVKWADAESLEEGSFLSAIRPDGEAHAMGVLSVRERSLKAEDQGFLGIAMDPGEEGPGVRVKSVEEGSAAEEAGILQGDVIKKIDEEEIQGGYELSNRLRRMKDGDQPVITLQRAKKILQVSPTLKGRVENRAESRRLEHMDRMSGSQSRVRGDFRNVIQSDMELESSDVGMPVVDLEGRIVGMVIARAGRISTLILPGDDLAQIIQGELTPFKPRSQGRDRQGGFRFRGEGGRDWTGQEAELMRRLMESLQFHLDRK